jgi:hypothetical protein
MAGLSFIITKSLQVVTIDFLLTLLSLYTFGVLNTKKLFYNKNFKPIEEKFFLWGEFVKSNTDREKEKDVFIKLSLNKKLKRYISSIFIFITGMTIVITLDNYQSSFIPVFCACLMLATYWRHLYFIFIVKVILTVVFVASSIDVDRVSIALVLPLILMSLIIFTKRELKLNPKACLKFLFVAFLVTLAFPETKLENDIKQIELQKIIKMKRTNINFKLSAIESSLELQIENLDDQVDGMIKKIDAMEDLLQNFPDIGIEFKNSMSNTKIELTGMKKEIKSTLDQGKLSSKSVSKLLKRMKEIKGRNFLNVTSDSNINEEKLNLALGSTGNKFSENLDEGSGELIESLKEIQNKIFIKENLQTERKEIENVVKKEKLNRFNFDDILDAWWIASLFFLIVYVKSLFEKKETRILGPGQTREVITGLKKLRLLKLTPNEEVIKSYNLWREKIHEVHFEGCEVPPPMNLASYFYSNRKKMHDSLNSLSQTFCDCYYGDLSASSKELQTFRKNIQEILTH